MYKKYLFLSIFWATVPKIYFCRGNWTLVRDWVISDIYLEMQIDVNRFLSKGMPSIYLKVTIEKTWRTRNFDFPSLKGFCPGFWVARNHADIINFQTYCCNLKIRGLGAKLCAVFLLFLFCNNYDILKSKSC